MVRPSLAEEGDHAVGEVMDALRVLGPERGSTRCSCQPLGNVGIVDPGEAREPGCEAGGCSLGDTREGLSGTVPDSAVGRGQQPAEADRGGRGHVVGERLPAVEVVRPGPVEETGNRRPAFDIYRPDQVLTPCRVANGQVQGSEMVVQPLGVERMSGYTCDPEQSVPDLPSCTRVAVVGEAPPYCGDRSWGDAVRTSQEQALEERIDDTARNPSVGVGYEFGELYAVLLGHDDRECAHQPSLRRAAVAEATEPCAHRLGPGFRQADSADDVAQSLIAETDAVPSNLDEHTFGDQPA